MKVLPKPNREEQIVIPYLPESEGKGDELSISNQFDSYLVRWK